MRKSLVFLLVTAMFSMVSCSAQSEPVQNSTAPLTPTTASSSTTSFSGSDLIAQATSEEITFVELMWLESDGGGIEAAQDYFSKIGPLLQRYNVSFNASYRPVEVLNGYLQAPDFIFSYTFPSKEALQAFSPGSASLDPDYAKLIPTRNKIFNFDDKILFRVESF